MFKYKRGIGNKESLKNTAFFITDNKDAMCSLAANFGAYRPYDGLYIKDKKVLVENLIEEVEIKNNIYKLANLATSINNISCDEYIKSIDLDKNEIEYEFAGVSFLKSIFYDLENENLIINYKVINNNSSNIKFRICPLVTDRGFYIMKNSQMLHFTQRKINRGVVLNLSVHDNRNLYIVSDKVVYDKESDYINNVKHTVINEKLEKKPYTEDLFIPGVFEINIRKNDNEEFNIIISSKDIETGKMDIESIKESYFEYRNSLISKIPEEYVELKDMAICIDNFNLNSKISGYPYIYEVDSIYQKDETTLDKLLNYMEFLIDYTKSIDGRFVVLGKENDAISCINEIGYVIKDISSLNIEYENFVTIFNKLKLWYIEILNKVIGENTHLITPDRVSFLKFLMDDMLCKENEERILKNIETAALMFNAIKIYRYMLSKINQDEGNLLDIELSIKNLIETKFWVPEFKCMKENLDDEIVKTNISMIYTLSLSYPCIVGENSIKLLDTIFKELYTPYGLRKMKKNTLGSDGMIYPKYLAHFIKANLRQNGITAASKKISYNLVKELIVDINKNINGGVPKVYNERGIRIDDISYDMLTNAEIIRLYDMLT